MWKQLFLSSAPREDPEMKKQHRHGDTPWYARVLPVRVVLAFWASVIVTALLCIPLAVEASNARENGPNSGRNLNETTDVLPSRPDHGLNASENDETVDVSVLGASESNDNAHDGSATSVDRLVDELRWTTDPDAVSSGPNDLVHGATIDGVVYIFLDLDNVAQVDFWINGKLTATDRSAPWELFGGGALDTSTLDAGQHTVGALATLTDGSVQLIEAEFTVE